MLPYLCNAAKHCILLLIPLVVFQTSLHAQQFLTKINGWNAYVHLPSDYDMTRNHYPAIIFMSGMEQVGDDAEKLLTYGPPHYINAGHSMEFIVDGVLETPIVISLQPPTPWKVPSAIDIQLDSIISRYRVDTNRMALTGISMGGWCWSEYVTENIVYTRRPASIVNMSAPPPDSISNFSYYATNGGKWWGFEGTFDYRSMDKIDAVINKAVKGASRVTRYPEGHCCWNTFYDPEWNEDGESIYTWMLKQKRKGAPYNQAPVARAGADTTITLPGSRVVLVSRSTDADGKITANKWSKIEGPSSFHIKTPDSASTVVDSLVAGIYKWVLTVTDNKGLTDTDTVQVTVRLNQLPVVDAGKDVVLTLPLDSVQLTGKVSDREAGRLSSSWMKVSGPSTFHIKNPEKTTTWVGSLVEGEYQFLLRAEDEDGGNGMDTVRVSVQPVRNAAPVAIAGADQVLTLPLAGVVLDGTASYDPDGSIVRYSWRQAGGASVDLTSATSSKAATAGYQPGTYTYELVVTDNDHATDTDSMTITVLPPVNLEPVASAGNDLTIHFPQTSVELDGTMSADPDGNQFTSNWTQIQGPSSGTISEPGSSKTTVNGLVPGVYIFELIVTDQAGAIGRDSIRVNVFHNATAGWALNIYPNPVAGFMNFKYLAEYRGKLGVLIINAGGIRVYSMEYQKQGVLFTGQVNVSNLTQGIYTLVLEFADGKKLSGKFIKGPSSR